MAKNGVESCGRCSMSTVVEAASSGTDGADRDPFAGERIEVAESDLRRVSGHVVWLGRLKHRLDAFATSLIYGR